MSIDNKRRLEELKRKMSIYNIIDNSAIKKDPMITSFILLVILFF